VAGVTPIDIRLKEICRRENVRIDCLDASHPLRELKEQSLKSRGHSTPMKFLEHSCKNLHKWMKDERVVMEEQSVMTHTRNHIESQKNKHLIKMFDVNIGNSKSRTMEQKKPAQTQSDKKNQILLLIIVSLKRMKLKDQIRIYLRAN
jgi:hypothetical protein